MTEVSWDLSFVQRLHRRRLITKNHLSGVSLRNLAGKENRGIKGSQQ